MEEPMSDIDFQQINIEDFKELYESINYKVILDKADQLTSEQLIYITKSLATPSSTDSNKKKLIKILEALTKRSSLEAIGAAINVNQFLQAIEAKDQLNKGTLHKIPPLLVGMHFSVFSKILSQIQNDTLVVLQEEGGTEPLQHQLTLFCHELTQRLNNYISLLIELEDEIDLINIQNINNKTLINIHNKIQKYNDLAQQNLLTIQNALALAWNTNRPEIIKNLSFQNEAWTKYKNIALGHHRDHNTAASGLYARLESRLNTIFGNPEDPNDIEALDDEEPAIEALVKFSLWYLHDYWEIGLLPEVDNINQLDLDPTKFSDRERAEYRANLFKSAQLHLEKAGFRTVKDLKDREIYSKQMLEDYLKKSMQSTNN